MTNKGFSVTNVGPFVRTKIWFAHVPCTTEYLRMAMFPFNPWLQHQLIIIHLAQARQVWGETSLLDRRGSGVGVDQNRWAQPDWNWWVPSRWRKSCWRPSRFLSATGSGYEAGSRRWDPKVVLVNNEFPMGVPKIGYIHSCWFRVGNITKLGWGQTLLVDQWTACVAKYCEVAAIHILCPFHCQCHMFV